MLSVLGYIVYSESSDNVVSVYGVVPDNNSLTDASGFGGLDFMATNDQDIAQSEHKSVVVFNKDGLALTFDVEPGYGCFHNSSYYYDQSRERKKDTSRI